MPSCRSRGRPRRRWTQDIKDCLFMTAAEAGHLAGDQHCFGTAVHLANFQFSASSSQQVLANSKWHLMGSQLSTTNTPRCFSINRYCSCHIFRFQISCTYKGNSQTIVVNKFCYLMTDFICMFFIDYNDSFSNKKNDGRSIYFDDALSYYKDINRYF